MFALPLLFSCLLLFSSAEKSEEDLIQEYLKELKESGYDPRIIPEGNGGPDTTLKVQVSMYILDIDKVDDNAMNFDGHFYFRQKWNDSRLEYKGKYKNIESILLRSIDEIWTPDLFFVEAREGFLHKIIHPNIFVRISPDGEVLFSVRLSMKFGCKMDLRKYPHDIQSCIINVESYGFARKDIDVEWLEKGHYNPLTASDNLSLIEFDLIELEPTKTYSNFTFGQYSAIQINLKFKRKIGFFATRLYVPFVMLVSLSWLSLWIRSEEKCLRLGLLVVILYLMFNISHEVNEAIPPVSYTKASDVWIGFCETLVFAIFLECILVYLMLRKKSEDYSSSKGELLPTLETEAKEHSLGTDSLKSPFSKFVNMLDARKGGKSSANATSYRIDKICRILVPIIFIIFNIVYWSVYCSA